ncbi:hypothetical protein [Microbacterium sp.]|jgi:hypothetical protein|uniref:hypothetical protein n=1 Tax=Microbacterium sp. TaxID=51671 RepID=UPI002606AECB|nr:hypothetical protein [Microbacterium sp.]
MIPPEADPWAWSLDVVLSLAGIAVAVLGALATVLFAWLALQQTRRANAFEVEARSRADRAALSGAVDAYLASWAPLGAQPRTGEATAAAVQTLHAAAAGISSEARGVARWLIKVVEASDLAELGRRQGPPDPGWTEHPPRDLIGLSIRVQARARVTDWVATGKLDRAPLFAYEDREATDA